jgi:hypothetical protein
MKNSDKRIWLLAEALEQFLAGMRREAIKEEEYEEAAATSICEAIATVIKHLVEKEGEGK